MLLTQKKYISNLLDELGMSTVAPTPTPMVCTPKLTVSDGSPLVDSHLYRSVIYSL